MAGSDDEAVGLDATTPSDETATDPARRTASSLPASSAAPAHASGTTIGRYTLAGVLGSGGMGVVYRAFDPHLGRAIALKVVRPGHDSAETKARLIREARAMAKLAHPNVIAVHDAGSVGHEVFVAMELVDGPNLAAWLAAEPRAWSAVLAMFEQSARGLIAAHAAGLVHRDFKPLNVLVGDDGRVRVLDFGLARSIDAPQESTDLARSVTAPPSLTLTGAILGTPLYMAPEQHTGGSTDARTDQFAFCVALFHALFGAYPFRGATLSELQASLMEDSPVVPTGTRVPGWLRRIVLRGIAVRPEARFPSMQAFLDEVALGQRLSRRRRGVAIGLPFVAAIAIVAIVLLRGGPATAKLPAVASATPEQITFDGRARGPALSHDGRHLAYFSGSFEYFGEVDVIVQDLATGAARTLIAARSTASPRWSPDDRSLLVSNDVGPLIVPLDGSAPTQLAGCERSAWSPDGREIVVHCAYDGFWSFVEIATGRSRTIEVTIPGSSSTDSFDWSPTGTLLVESTDPTGSSLWTMRSDGKDLREAFRASTQIYDPRWSATGETIYYARMGNQLAELVMLTYDAASGRAAAVDTKTIRDPRYAISDDATTLVTAFASDQVNLVALEGGKRTVLTQDTERKTAIRASRDGGRIAFAANSSERSRVHVLASGGTPVMTLPPVAGSIVDLAWSPDGSELGYLVETDAGRSLWRVTLATGATVELVHTDLGSELDWSPSGKIVVQQADNTNLLAIDPATGAQRPLFAAPQGWIFRPRASPDGTRLLAYRNDGESSGVWVVGLDGALRDYLYAGRMNPIGWSPDGRTAYVADMDGAMKALAIDLATHATTIALETQLETQRLLPIPEGWIAVEDLSRSDLWAASTQGPLSLPTTIAPYAGPQGIVNPTPTNLTLSRGDREDLPRGWFAFRPPGFRASSVVHDGRRALELAGSRSIKLVQRIDATAYRGKRVKVRFAIATEAGAIGLQVASIAGKHSLSAGELRSISHGWVAVETLADIHPDADTIEIRILTVSGTTWIADGAFEVVH